MAIFTHYLKSYRELKNSKSTQLKNYLFIEIQIESFDA